MQWCKWVKRIKRRNMSYSRNRAVLSNSYIASSTGRADPGFIEGRSDKRPLILHASFHIRTTLQQQRGSNWPKFNDCLRTSPDWGSITAIPFQVETWLNNLRTSSGWGSITMTPFQVKTWLNNLRTSSGWGSITICMTPFRWKLDWTI